MLLCDLKTFIEVKEMRIRHFVSQIFIKEQLSCSKKLIYCKCIELRAVGGKRAVTTFSLSKESFPNFNGDPAHTLSLLL